MSMTSQHRIQQYMERHKIAPLFEDLMNKVIHDQPDEPLLYLIRVLCKKAGKEIPPEAKLSHLRRSTSDLPHHPSSPEMSRKNRNSAWATSTDPTMRPYERPWLSHSKKVKPKNGNEQVRPGRRQTTDWNPDTKVVSSNFDDLFEEHKGGKSRKTGAGQKPDADHSRRAWASYGLGDGEENLFSSSGYSGPRKASQEDPLAGEIVTSHKRALPGETVERSSAVSVSSSRIRGPRTNAEKHKRELEKLVRESDRKSTDSGIYDDHDDTPDDAVELLEDAEDLRREGVKNIPSKGYRLSRTLRQSHADPEVKLNINLYTGSGPMPSLPPDGVGYGDPRGSDYYDFEQDGSPLEGRYSPDSDDDEFESVSQVTGPRRPIWNAEDSDGERTTPKPSLSLQQKSATAALPYSSDNFDEVSRWDRQLVDTTPMASGEFYHSKSMESAEMFPPSRKHRDLTSYDDIQESLETEGRHSGDLYGGRSGGWVVKEGSEVSATDWKGSRKGRSYKHPDYTSY